MSFLVVGLNPVIQRTHRVNNLTVGASQQILSSRTDLAGQGANTTRMLNQLGAAATYLSQVGVDDWDLYSRLVSFESMVAESVEAPGGVRNCHTLIDVSSSEVTEIVEEGPRVGPDVEEAVRKRFVSVLPSHSWVVITGSKAVGFSEELVPFMVSEAKSKGKRIGLDIREADLKHSLPYSPDFVKINVPEFLKTVAPHVDAAEREIDSEHSTLIADKLSELTADGSTAFALTHARNSSYLAVAGHVTHMQPPLVETTNTIGCGDAVMAGMLWALENGATFEEALHKGHECAATNAQLLKPGSLVDAPPLE